MSQGPKAIALDSLERLQQVVEEEEQAHRTMALFVEELIGQSSQPLTAEQMGRYIETMQSFDRMRQRVGYLCQVAACVVSASEDCGAELNRFVESSPSPEDGQWLNIRLAAGWAGA
ncbi:MAG: hypothetical protein AB8B93_18820 [Pseudomonadales bacterium]